VLLTEDVISGIVKAVCTLPDKAAEEISQEMVRIIRHSRDLETI
jgi:hypothetical protein